ncbi:eukaryotic translation initiation factor 3 subunit J-A-like isoform X2 [Mizuhopecten yessoensis]|uniref:eukaryotic translation initiation factor 3 subunit J-A-like isoform X2 n=1 Tax=Mizuhopecten yessoensis TaxID=6573 RepID=UPI000B45F05E|nr:eukaryotic translation initiation factor 3 subunit J-A-like isoform X2 [Mizuhopecten yessoensis]
MSDEWDADDFDVNSGFTSNPNKAAWAGEDEDHVKDNWEDDEEEKKAEESGSAAESGKAFQRKKKKLADRIAEKQAAKKKAQEEEQRVLTPEEELSEKLRRRKLQEESDLKLAKEAFGTSDITGIDAMFPETEEEYQEFEEALKNKITYFDKSKHYVSLIEKLFTDIVLTLETEDVRKVGSCITTIYQEKQKQQKELKKKEKKKNKITIRSEREGDFGDLAAASSGHYDDIYDEDFI